MKTSKTLIYLSILVALLALVQAGAGLFWQDGGSPFTFTNLRGKAIQMSGQGIYRDNPAFNVPILRGTDAVTLFLFIPLLVVAILLYRRGSLRGRLLLTGLLAIFLYDAASIAFGVTYNQLFLVYIAFFSAGLFAFVLAVTEVDLQVLASRVTSRAPRTGIAILVFISAVGLLFAWIPDIINGLPQGWNAQVAIYTTVVTDVLDLGIIVPALVLAGVLLLRRAPLGDLLAAILTIMLILMGIVLTAQSVAQSLAGIMLTPGEFIGKAGSFMLLSLFGIWLIVRFFQSISEERDSRKDAAEASRA